MSKRGFIKFMCTLSTIDILNILNAYTKDVSVQFQPTCSKAIIEFKHVTDFIDIYNRLTILHANSETILLALKQGISPLQIELCLAAVNK